MDDGMGESNTSPRVTTTQTGVDRCGQVGDAMGDGMGESNTSPSRQCSFMCMMPRVARWATPTCRCSDNNARGKKRRKVLT